MRNLAPHHPLSKHMFARRGCVAVQFQREPINDMQTEGGVAIFWDFETAKIEGKGSGCQVARELSSIADQFGVVKTFRTYLDVMNQLNDNFSTIRRELYSSGVTMVDCPSHSGRDIADKVIIVDMLSFIMDQPPPYTIVVATGDNDLCLTLAILRRRRYKVVLVCPLQRDCEYLLMQADETRRVEWIGTTSGNAGSPSPSSSSSPSSPSSVLSYADFDTRRSVQNSITNERKVGSTTERSKKLTYLHIPDIKPTGDGLDIGSQRSNDSMTPSPGGSPHHVPDIQKPRDHTGISSDSFFPPVPSFPLEAQPKATVVPVKKVHKSVAGRKSPSPQSTEEFSVVDVFHDGSPKPARNRSSSPVPALTTAFHQPLPIDDFSVTNSSKLPKLSSDSVTEPVATAQSTTTPPTPALPTTFITDAPLTTTTPEVPQPSIAAPITMRPAVLPRLMNVSSAARTSTTPQTMKTPRPATPGRLPVKYHRLVIHLQDCRRSGDPWPNMSKLAETLVRENSKFYELVGVKKWGTYVSQAVDEGIVVLEKGGKIALAEKWMNVVV